MSDKQRIRERADFPLHTRWHEDRDIPRSDFGDTAAGIVIEIEFKDGDSVRRDCLLVGHTNEAQGLCACCCIMGTITAWAEAPEGLIRHKERKTDGPASSE
jgi:hypothetical protein